MAKTLPFTGSGVAIVTPFDGQKTNYDVLGELIDWHIENKTDAIIICGTTGEASTMPDAEHLAAIEYTVKKVNGRIPVVAGTGSNCTREAVDLSKKAEEVGADGLLCVTPYYNKATQAGLYEYYKAISDAVNIPIAATHHRVAAVFNPFILFPSLRITPAPKKPIPDTI